MSIISFLFKQKKELLSIKVGFLNHGIEPLLKKLAKKLLLAKNCQTEKQNPENIKMSI